MVGSVATCVARRKRLAFDLPSCRAFAANLSRNENPVPENVPSDIKALHGLVPLLSRNEFPLSH